MTAGALLPWPVAYNALHDGFTDLIYVLLPVWQAEFGLSYAALGVLRLLFAGAMAGLQVPASWLAARFGGKLLLTAGTALLAGGVLVDQSQRRRARLAGSGAADRRRRRGDAAPDRIVAGGDGVRAARFAGAAGHLQFRRRPGKDGDPGGGRMADGAAAMARRGWMVGALGLCGAAGILLLLPRARRRRCARRSRQRRRRGGSDAAAGAVPAAADDRRAG